MSGRRLVGNLDLGDPQEAPNSISQAHLSPHHPYRIPECPCPWPPTSQPIPSHILKKETPKARRQTLWKEQACPTQAHSCSSCPSMSLWRPGM